MVDRPRIAVAIHGFLRTGAAMWWMGRRLRAEGYRDVLMPTLGYHLRPIEASAEQAAAAIRTFAARWPDHDLDLVTHSYGGVLARAAWATQSLPPIRRGVLLSPPNRGATAAQIMRGWVPVHRIGWDPLAQVLPGVPNAWPLPPGEIGILTGGLGHSRGINPLLGDDNDGTVRVDEARHDGAVDFKVVALHHSLMILSPSAIDHVVRFLKTGRFDPVSTVLGSPV